MTFGEAGEIADSEEADRSLLGADDLYLVYPLYSLYDMTPLQVAHL